MRTILRAVAAPALLSLCVAVSAEEVEPPPAVSAAVQSLMPGIAPSWLKPAPMAGLWEVAFGPQIFYISGDGQHLLHGDIVAVASRENLTRAARNAARANAVADAGEGTMIVFSPPVADVAHTVTVFTDVDCGYCAKLHREMQTYLDAGIRVRYMAFPRAGVGSGTYRTMVSVWCAADQRQAMTDAKAGRDVAPSQCENPVASHYELGRLLGVRGTPTIVLQSGDVVPGYVPAPRLLEALQGAETRKQG